MLSVVMSQCLVAVMWWGSRQWVISAELEGGYGGRRWRSHRELRRQLAAWEVIVSAVPCCTVVRAPGLGAWGKRDV